VTLLVRDVLDEQGLRGWPKISGSRGMHVNVRIQRRWSFEQVRRAALALAREVERRAPDLASSKMVEGGTPWGLPRLQPERQGPDRGLGLVGAAHARRARVDASRVGTEGGRLRSCGIHAGHRAGAVCGTRRRVGRHRQRGGIPRCTPRAVCIARGLQALGDAPWPPHYKKQRDEPPRVAPSRRKASGPQHLTPRPP